MSSFSIDKQQSFASGVHSRVDGSLVCLLHHKVINFISKSRLEIKSKPENGDSAMLGDGSINENEYLTSVI